MRLADIAQGAGAIFAGGNICCDTGVKGAEFFKVQTPQSRYF